MEPRGGAPCDAGETDELELLARKKRGLTCVAVEVQLSEAEGARCGCACGYHTGAGAGEVLLISKKDR